MAAALSTRGRCCDALRTSPQNQESACAATGGADTALGGITMKSAVQTRERRKSSRRVDGRARGSRRRDPHLVRVAQSAKG